MRLLTVSILASALAAAACTQAPAAAQEPVATTLDGAYRQALALTPLPYEVENQHRYWLSLPADERGDETYELERLQRRIVQDRKARAVRTTTEALQAGCVDIVLKGCSVTSGGFVQGGDQRLWFQIQDGFTDEDGVGGGVVIFEQEAGGALKPIYWTFEGSRYDAPMLTPHGEGQWLLIVPGISRGTGSGDMTVMMLWRDGAWRAVDVDWQSRAGDLLKGFEVRHQPRWHFPELSAHTPLWRASDANCCGEGGSAGLTFDIVQDRLTLTDVNIQGRNDD
ncbi:MAG TPA: hypothetical protein PLQ03_07130 [Brevundimonas sp.]|uniref:hypothetical protein n=1 Tax=Brevundimonas sp. TaxID=1871086 RepID=UPI00261BFFEA|nr:hypothetical protein [Brevundimonas sp.]HRO33172.1 hypothetical protein [Brevundimonas sp.]